MNFSVASCEPGTGSLQTHRCRACSSSAVLGSFRSSQKIASIVCLVGLAACLLGTCRACVRTCGAGNWYLRSVGQSIRMPSSNNIKVDIAFRMQNRHRKCSAGKAARACRIGCCLHVCIAHSSGNETEHPAPDVARLHSLHSLACHLTLRAFQFIMRVYEPRGSHCIYRASSVAVRQLQRLLRAEQHTISICRPPSGCTLQARCNTGTYIRLLQIAAVAKRDTHARACVVL